MNNNKILFGDVEAIFSISTPEIKEIEMEEKIQKKSDQIHDLKSREKTPPPKNRVNFEEATQNYSESFEEERKEIKLKELSYPHPKGNYESTQNYQV